jgi:hypothetical protein
MDEMDLIDIYRAFHPMAADYTFFSEPMELSPKQITSYVIKQIPTNRKKNQNNPHILTVHIGKKLETNGKENDMEIKQYTFEPSMGH